MCRSQLALAAADDELLASLGSLGERSLTGSSGARLGDELLRLRRMADLIELEFSRVAVAFAATDEYDMAGYDSAVQWIRETCHTTVHAAASAISVGEQSPRIERSVRALRDGEIGFAHLALIARTADAASDAGVVDRFPEEKLLAKAKQHTVKRFYRDCTQIRHSFDALALLHEHIDMVEARFLRVMPQNDGAMWFRGFLDPEAAASLTTALLPLAKRQGANDLRSRDKRHADALVDLVQRALDSATLPHSSGQRPHLQVTTTLDTLLGLEGSPAGELHHAGLIPTETVQRLACDASVARIVFGPDSAVIDVGRALRIPGPATRRALQARDRGCVWPGCDNVIASTSAHHIVHWAVGGKTDLDNLVLLCRRHHWRVHEEGWHLVRREDGRIVVIAPVDQYQPYRPPPDDDESAATQAMVTASFR